jgi:uncharacterized protein YggE
MSRSDIVIIVSAALLLAIATGPARAQLADGPGAQGNVDGFAVVGKGTAATKPNRLEIDLEVSASSELSADAIVKYRDAKKRLQDAFSTLKMKNVAVEERGLLVDQKGQAFNPYYMDTPPARKGKVEVQLRRKLVVSVSNIRSMDEEALLQLVAKLLDVAQDAGGKVGGSEGNPYYFYRFSQGSKLVRFILDDYDALQEKAYGEAIADARSKATRLAKLSGVELGRVAGIRELVVPGEKAPAAGMPYYYYEMQAAGNDEEVPRKRLEASRFQEIPVHVELQVRFELAGPAKVAKRGAQ